MDRAGSLSSTYAAQGAAATPARWLPTLIAQLGSRDFGGAVAEALATDFGVGHVCVFAFSSSGAVKTLLTEGRMDVAMAGRLARDYGEGGWFQSDPHLRGLLAAGSEMRRLRLGRAYTREYRRRFFDAVGSTGKLAYALRGGDGCRIYASFHQIGAAPGDIAERLDAERLDPWAPTLGALLERHRTVLAGAGRGETAGALARLPRREREVCEGILAGLTSEGIALTLGVSRNTVLTLRRRAYQRLGVHSQSQLIRLALGGR